MRPSRKTSSVHHPKHYTQHPSGIECIDVIEAGFSFCVASIIKYAWRCGRKGAAVEDLEKIIWYAQREIERLEKQQRGTR